MPLVTLKPLPPPLGRLCPQVHSLPAKCPYFSCFKNAASNLFLLQARPISHLPMALPAMSPLPDKGSPALDPIPTPGHRVLSLYPASALVGPHGTPAPGLVFLTHDSLPGSHAPHLSCRRTALEAVTVSHPSLNSGREPTGCRQILYSKPSVTATSLRSACSRGLELARQSRAPPRTATLCPVLHGSPSCSSA